MLQLTLLAALPLLAQCGAFNLGQPTRCVPIPRHMSMCQDVGYFEMRLPNFLGHRDLEREVVPRSEDWRPLLMTGCHPQAEAFLCSLIAPICLDAFVQPCRSLCMAVRDSCAPVLACQGQTWPELLECERFPAGEDLCLTTISQPLASYTALPQAVCQECPVVLELPSQKTLLNSFCRSDFVVRAKLSRRRMHASGPEFEVEGGVDFVVQGPLLLFDTTSLLQQWMLVNLHCARALVRPGRALLYLLAGTIQPQGTVILNHLFPWHKRDVNIAVATRKWKHHRC